MIADQILELTLQETREGERLAAKFVAQRKRLFCVPGAHLPTAPAWIALRQSDKGLRHRFFTAFQVRCKLAADRVIDRCQTAQLSVPLGGNYKDRELAT